MENIWKQQLWEKKVRRFVAFLSQTGGAYKLKRFFSIILSVTVNLLALSESLSVSLSVRPSVSLSLPLSLSVLLLLACSALAKMFCGSHCPPQNCPVLVRTACYLLKVGLAHNQNAKRNDRFCHGCEARGEAGLEQWSEQWLEPHAADAFHAAFSATTATCHRGKAFFTGKNVSCNIVQR